MVPVFSFAYFPLMLVLLVLYYFNISFSLTVIDALTSVFMLMLKCLSAVAGVMNFKVLLINKVELVILTVLIFICFLLIKYSRSLNRRLALCIYAFFVMFAVILFLYFKHHYEDVNRITVFDIYRKKNIRGSGDFIYIRNNKINFLIDTGMGGYSTVTVLKSLLRNKTDRLDYLVITHPDADHIGGLRDLLTEKRINVNTILLNQMTLDYIKEKKLYKYLSDRVSNMAIVCKGSGLEHEGARYVDFVNPVCGRQKYKSANANALSSVHKINSYNILFSSDIPYHVLSGLYPGFSDPGDKLIVQMSHHCSSRDNPRSIYKKYYPLFGFCTRSFDLTDSGINKDSFGFPIFMTGHCGTMDIRFTSGSLIIDSEKCSEFIVKREI
jgi:beta-lactamase superfamily II metal-dependent hydrolase